MILIVKTLFLLAIASSVSGIRDNRFIGWEGEKKVARAISTISKAKDPNAPWIEQISWKPRAYVYHNFLSKAEAKHIIDLAGPHMKRSTVVGGNDSVLSDYRTSYGTFINRNLDSTIESIEKRLSLWTHLPPIFQEDMQVLRYAVTNKYGPHTDGLGRVATVLMYLVEPKAGGETAFIHGDWASEGQAARAAAANFSDCAKGHVAFRPKQGDALLFYDRLPDYRREDLFSEHTGCPVVEGVKWNAVKWIHGEPFNPTSYSRHHSDWMHNNDPDPGLCEDRTRECRKWADAGECTNNHGYMEDNCARACKLCSPCDANDSACINANRARAGYIVLDPRELGTLMT